MHHVEHRQASPRRQQQVPPRRRQLHRGNLAQGAATLASETTGYREHRRSDAMRSSGCPHSVVYIGSPKQETYTTHDQSLCLRSLEVERRLAAAPTPRAGYRTTASASISTRSPGSIKALTSIMEAAGPDGVEDFAVYSPDLLQRMMSASNMRMPRRPAARRRPAPRRPRCCAVPLRSARRCQSRRRRHQRLPLLCCRPPKPNNPPERYGSSRRAFPG